MARCDEVEGDEPFSVRRVGVPEVAGPVDDTDDFLVLHQHDGAVLPSPIAVDRIRAADSAARSR